MFPFRLGLVLLITTINIDIRKTSAEDRNLIGNSGKLFTEQAGKSIVGERLRRIKRSNGHSSTAEKSLEKRSFYEHVIGKREAKNWDREYPGHVKEVPWPSRPPPSRPLSYKEYVDLYYLHPRSGRPQSRVSGRSCEYPGHVKPIPWPATRPPISYKEYVDRYYRRSARPRRQIRGRSCETPGHVQQIPWPKPPPPLSYKEYVDRYYRRSARPNPRPMNKPPHIDDEDTDYTDYEY